MRKLFFTALAASVPQCVWTEGSLITSSQRNVKLDSGTQMVLRVVGQS